MHPSTTPSGREERGVTVRDVARLAGVSHGTVSNVLNRPDRVTQKTRQKVEEAMQRLAFVPNEAARQLSGGRSRLLGLVLLDLENPFFLEVARGVEDAASAAGYVVMLFNAAGSADREARALEALREHRVSGVLLSPVSRMAEGVPRLRAQGAHVVFLDRRAPRADFCSVAVDDHHGGAEAMSHLVSRGHTRVAFVSGPSHLRQHQARLRGVRAAAVVAGLDPDDIIVFREEMSVVGGERAGRRILAEAAHVTAVVCANDQLAFGVERATLEAGRSVPRDLAIVGYDNVDISSHAQVPISSVSQPMYEMGRASIRLLIDEIENEAHAHEQLLYTPTLIARESS